MDEITSYQNQRGLALFYAIYAPFLLLLTFFFEDPVVANFHHVRLIASVMIQYFSLTTKQYQPVYKPQKRSSEHDVPLCFILCLIPRKYSPKFIIGEGHNNDTEINYTRRM